MDRARFTWWWFEALNSRPILRGDTGFDCKAIEIDEGVTDRTYCDLFTFDKGRFALRCVAGDHR